MAYQVIARKWRPQAFDDVTGQEHITQTLRNAIEHDRLHHAYLFSGARGVGKTTTARLLAKALNCHKAAQPTATPCSFNDLTACPSCKEIAEGRSMDVLEIDAASNTGVDNVRDAIIGNVAISPARDRYKVFIIDEVHMLSGAAFNALLKTLEEPPARVVFIMATTEKHKLPETILSRCQQFEFRTIPLIKIAERLRLIADAEKIAITDDAVREIARAGEGSMRDAQSAFDQTITFSTGAKIEATDVEAALGVAGRELLSRTVQAIADREPTAALDMVNDLVMRGHDLRNFCRDLLAHIRDLLIVKVAGDAVLLDSSATPEHELKEQALTFAESDLTRFFHSLTETEQLLKTAAHPRYQLEIGLIKLIEMRRLTPLSALLERLSALENSLGNGGKNETPKEVGAEVYDTATAPVASPDKIVSAPAAAVADHRALRDDAAASVQTQSAAVQSTPPAPESNAPASGVAEHSAPHATEFDNFASAAFETELENLKRALESLNRPLIAIKLDAVRRIALRGDVLSLEFAPNDKESRAYFARAEVAQAVREACLTTFGRAVEPRFGNEDARSLGAIDGSNLNDDNALPARGVTNKPNGRDAAIMSGNAAPNMENAQEAESPVQLASMPSLLDLAAEPTTRANTAPATSTSTVTLTADGGSDAPPAPKLSEAEIKARAQQHPLVQTLQKTFGAQIISVRSLEP